MEKKRFVISVCVLALAGLISTWIFAGAVERENNRWLYDVTDSLVTEIVISGCGGGDDSSDDFRRGSVSERKCIEEIWN